ncbi:hypothetical protein CHARACLAT_012304 [Characodon lateralis]|uniref:Uncharacterized protein n=1 Tax=Characodon lateralis TaxID=208331 RepID=A0ABU7DQG1_9TELE|nr:hypothetical protein [Characodon lateralis]
MDVVYSLKLPDPSPQQPPSSSGEGAMYKRGVSLVQTSPPTRAGQDETVPTPPSEFRSQPHEPQHEFPHRATPNQDTDIEHMPPNPNPMNPLPTGEHPHR